MTTSYFQYILSALLTLFFFGFFASTAFAQGATCGKDTMTFGCHAYIYGNSGSAPSYAGKADSVFVDSQYMSQNPGVAQRLNQSGPVPLFYVNAYCERRFGGCSGPQLTGSSVAAQYGEYAQHPSSGEFYNNFNRQLAWVKQVQGKVIEIDNMDFYIQKGHKDAIVKLIQLAANAGINVLSKNVHDTDILRLPNVVGAVVERGSGNASQYHSAFQSVGKPCAGVLMINASSNAGNQYTSHTQCDHPSQGSRSEYTKCSCTKNPAGMQIAGTPVAGPNVDIPQSQLPQPYSQPAPQQGPGQSQQTQQPTGVQGSPGSSSPQQPVSQSPQQQPQFAQAPTSPTEKQTGVKGATTEKTKSGNEKFEVEETSGAPKKEKTKTAEAEETSFYDPLGGATKKGNEQNAKKGKQAIVPRPFGDARLRCIPNAIRAGARPTIAWSCGRNATSSTGVGFSTQNSLLGSVRVAPARTSLFAVNCYDGGTMTGSAQCVIQVRTEKSADESFGTTQKTQTENPRTKTLCFLSFCL